ncbi:hypothetical protein [Streptomyces malaysiensis]|uniref:Uncharacterized protein n=1 Tax=Streptomyces malaysiensis TaxID=92644 RepID=A0A7X6AV34_STRMQ|nr:hypothetical protein [Streptomyces malaysiensis]NIY62751.1 hypothetical protein [Streptomyces malaysiensis]
MRALVFDLKQVSRYLLDAEVRRAARQRVMDRITADTEVVVAHSLGSVVAYEALCALPEHPVRALVTGSVTGCATRSSTTGRMPTMSPPI